MNTIAGIKAGDRVIFTRRVYSSVDGVETLDFVPGDVAPVANVTDSEVLIRDKDNNWIPFIREKLPDICEMFDPDMIEPGRGPMNLTEVFALAKEDGFTHARDIYSYRGRPLIKWAKDIKADAHLYLYRRGAASQCSRFPSNEWVFWRDNV